MKKALLLLAAAALCAGLTCGASAQNGYTILHQFDDLTVPDDGRYPDGSLLLDGGVLYGMTRSGGVANQRGTIFSMGKDGSGYTILHDFGDGTVPDDGYGPRDTLILDGGRLYGAASHGGVGLSVGTVFSLNKDGSGYTILHNFGDGTVPGDGQNPDGSLISDGSRLYGMTRWGGAYVGPDRGGIIFSLDPGAPSPAYGYTIVHKFGDGSVTNDGLRPEGSLVSDGSRLYGMTCEGGTGPGDDGSGTIFSFDPGAAPPAYAYTILHNFANYPDDGARPLDSLHLNGNTLYGMTLYGGAANAGTIFSMVPDGSSFSLLHSFIDRDEGLNPRGSLISDGSTLYGMARGGYGGYAAMTKGPAVSGGGTVFSIGTGGSGFTVLHTFSGYPTDGDGPTASLVLDGGTLYGMTPGGGAFWNGVLFSQSSQVPTPTPTVTPTPAPLSYIDIGVSPETVNFGDPLTLSWECDFGRWDFRAVPIDIYLAAIRNPAVVGAPSSVADAQSGGAIIYFGKHLQYYTLGAPLEPTWSNVAFPPVKTVNSLSINLPLPPGNYVLAATFLYRGPVRFVRDDGLPVMNSNLFTIQ